MAEKEKPIYALSIKQPWAWLYLQPNMKDVENRDWHLKDRRFVPDDLIFPAKVYIHAGISKSELTKETLAWILKRLDGHQSALLMLQYQLFTGGSPLFTFGAIIGEAIITHYTLISKSRWFTGKYGFVRESPILYDESIPCRGQLGFFKPVISFKKLEGVNA